MGEGRGHSPCVPPVLLAAWAVPLCLTPHAQFCSPCLKRPGIHAVFCWLRVGVSPCPLVTYCTSAPSVVELASWCHRWGAQHFYWDDFPSGSPCSGWCQHTGALMLAQERGECREHYRTPRKNESDGLFGQLLQNYIQPFNPTLLTSLLPCNSAPGEATQDLGVPAGSVLFPSLLPPQEISSTGARMEQYLLICKLLSFQTAGKEKTTSRRQSQLGKERGKQASKAQWDDPCLQVGTKQVPGMHMASFQCFQWLWEPKACFPVSWKWATCSPVVLTATGQPPHTLLRKKDKKWSEMA